MRKTKLVATLGFFAVFIGAGALLMAFQPHLGTLSFASAQQPAELQNLEIGNPYVEFQLEAYDSIKMNFWKKLTDQELSALFQLSLEKAGATTTKLASPDRAGTEAMFEQYFASLSDENAKKQVAQDTLIVALFNLPPAGRNQLLTTKQEKTLREGVSNINPEKDLYADAGAKEGATVEEVKVAYEEKKAELEKMDTPEAKQELADAKYAHDVLTKEDTKERYDVAKVEPTIFIHTVGRTLYLNISKMSPTTFDEFVAAIGADAGTKNDTLIVDLRSNVGGALDISPALVGVFQGPNQYVFDLFRQDEFEPIRSPVPRLAELEKYKEVAILTDGMTQSTAEVITAALKRLRIAHVVGNTTRGWGTVENTFPLKKTIDPEAQYTMLLVHSLTLRDDNEPIETRGVTPDVDISDPKWKSKLGTFFRSNGLISAIEKTATKPPLRD